MNAQSVEETQREKSTSRNVDREDYSLQDIKSHRSFVTDVPSAFHMKFWSTAGEITLPDCLFAPKIFLTLCQAFEFGIQWAFVRKPRVTKLPSPILPLAWWLNSTAHWATYLLTAPSAMRKIKLTHTHTHWQRLSYFNVTRSGCKCRG